jgi:hypothetical protein
MTAQVGTAKAESETPVASRTHTAGSMRFFLVLAAVSLLVTGWIVGALSYDGSAYFLNIVDFRTLYQPFQRYSSAPFELPTVVAVYATSSLSLLRHIFGLSYALAPLTALSASWLVVRHRQPRLVVWPVLGIAIVAFPAILFPISESAIVAMWAWPLVLVALVSLDSTPSVIAGVAFTVFLLFLAANSLLIFCVVAAIAAVRAAREPALRRRLLTWTAFMVVTAIVRYVVLNADFSTAGHQLPQIWHEISGDFRSLAFIAYIAVFLAGLVLIALRFAPNAGDLWVRHIATALVVVAGVLLAVYASSDTLWTPAIDARDLTVALELPFFLFCALDQLGRMPLGADAVSAVSVRDSIVMTSGVVLCVSLALFCASWSTLTGRLTKQVSAETSYCVNPVSLKERATMLARSNPKNLEALVIDLQTKTPAHIAISSADCALLHSSGVLELNSFTAPAHGEWFTFQGP